MKKRSSGSPPKYSDQEKIAIARQYLSSDLGYGELGKRYGLSRPTVIHFVRWYRHHHCDEITGGEHATTQHQAGPLKASPSATAASERAKDKELEQARLKIAALELLLANAKKELGIDLLKKPGTKQSNK